MHQAHVADACISAPNFAQGFGWAISKCLAEAGAEVSLGVWVSETLALLSSVSLGRGDPADVQLATLSARCLR